ncbi:HYR domain-containing protein, partial [Aureisphaera sp.]
MKKFTLTFLLLFAGCLAFGQSVFINEIHYDNAGGDIGEFVEVAGPAGTDLSTYSIVLYNGNGGATYNTVALSGTIDDEGAGFGAVSQSISGIQNGAPDGIALVDGVALVQFLSYEGSFTATNGPANGITSTDIGVNETSSTPVGESLQLTGTGNVYADFTWNAPAAESPGSINVGQTFSAGSGNPPMITCPSDVVTPASAGLCEAVVTFPDAIATDPDGDLDTVLQTGGLASGSAFPVGINTITYTATDLAGNSVSCSFTITVEDTQDPIAVCQDITVQLDANGQYILDPSEVDGGSTDNCGNVALSLDVTNLDCSFVGSNTLVLTATDDSGNTASCNVNVTVEDVTAPEVFCLGEINGEPVFINELHYDNGGTDQDEAIEIAGPAGTDLSVYTIVLYNGNGGAQYNEVPLSGTIDDEGNGYGAVNFPIAGIQNGSPDGIVLAQGGNVLQFISYEGSFTAIDGIANGMTSTDIGVEENSGTAIGESLQLTGTGSSSGDFTWNAPSASSPGSINAGQTFVAPTSSVLQVELDANGMASIDASALISSVNEACGFTVTGGTETTELMTNGSFETADLSGWTAIDNPNPFLPWGAYESNDGAGFFDPAFPTDGGWLAGNGFDGEAGEAVIFQDVTVPAGIASATLTWDENIDYDLASFCTGCQDRIYEVQVRDLSDNVLEVLVQITATAGDLDSDNVWESQTADLSAYAGQDIRIAYWQNIPDDFSGPAKFALDNVSLSAASPSTTIDFDCSNLGLNAIEVTVTDDSGNTATCTATVEVLDVTDPVLICQDVTIEIGPDGTTEIDPEDLLATAPSTFDAMV